MKLACMKCGKVLPLEVTVEEGEDLSSSEEFGMLPDKFRVDIPVPPGGILMALCMDCVTPRQAFQRMMELTAAMLESAEDYIENIEGIGRIQPALLDKPDVKASLVKAREQAAEARRQLEALAAVEHTIEDEDG